MSPRLLLLHQPVVRIHFSWPQASDGSSHVMVTSYLWLLSSSWWSLSRPLTQFSVPLSFPSHKPQPFTDQSGIIREHYLQYIFTVQCPNIRLQSGQGLRIQLLNKECTKLTSTIISQRSWHSEWPFQKVYTQFLGTGKLSQIKQIVWWVNKYMGPEGQIRKLSGWHSHKFMGIRIRLTELRLITSISGTIPKIMDQIECF